MGSLSLVVFVVVLYGDGVCEWFVCDWIEIGIEIEIEPGIGIGFGIGFERNFLEVFGNRDR